MYICGKEKKIGLLENCASYDDVIQNFSAAVSLMVTGPPCQCRRSLKWLVSVKIFPAHSLHSGSWKDGASYQCLGFHLSLRNNITIALLRYRNVSQKPRAGQLL